MTRMDISQYQGTVTRTLSFAGVGLHTGKHVEVVVRPAAPHTGIIFQRTDNPCAKPVWAHPDNISSTTLSTTIGHGSDSIATIEHFMAALAGLGIDNAFVEVSACELPILDGSSAPFVDKLAEVGVQIQSAKRKVYIPKRVIEVRQGEHFIRLEPYAGGKNDELAAKPSLEFRCSIDFPKSKAIGFQEYAVGFSRRAFMDLCEARTFCHVDDVAFMRANGLAQGGSLDNAIVVNGERIINADGLRYEDEFVRHKLLDCIGDIALLGGRLTGVLTLHKSGHALHAAFTKELLKHEACYVYPCPQTQRVNAIEGLGLAAMAKKDA